MAGFEKNLATLEAVVEKLEHGDLSLDESVRLFEQGMNLSEACRKELAAAEGKIQVLVERGNRMVIANLDVPEDIEENSGEE